MSPAGEFQAHQEFGGAEGEEAASAMAGTGWCSRFSPLLSHFSGLVALQEPVPAPQARLGEAENEGDKYFSLAFKERREILFA